MTALLGTRRALGRFNDPLNRGMGLWLPTRGNANDYSGNARHGTVSGAGLTPDRLGRQGRAYLLDGVDDAITVADFVETGDSGKQLSVFCWVNAAPPGDSDTLVAHYQESGDQRSWYMGEGPAGSRDKLRLLVYNGTSTVQKEYLSTAAVFDSTWHHVGFTFDGNLASTDRLKLWRDGLQAAVTKTTDLDFTTLFNSTASVSVGASYDGVPALVYQYGGSLADVRLYPRALAAGEVARLYRLRG